MQFNEREAKASLLLEVMKRMSIIIFTIGLFVGGIFGMACMAILCSKKISEIENELNFEKYENEKLKKKLEVSE